MFASLFLIKHLLYQNFPCLFKGTLHEGFHSFCMLFSFLMSVCALCNEQLCGQNQKTTGYGIYGHLDLKISSLYHIYILKGHELECFAAADWF